MKEKKYLVVSDVHENESEVNDLIKFYRPDHVLDCGDHEDSFYTDKRIPWYFIHGNHENFKEIKELRYNNPNKYKNLHYIPPGEKVKIDNLNVTGFGGNYSHKSYFGEKKPKPFHITRDDYKKVVNMRGKKNIDLLLMHESSLELWKDSIFEGEFGNTVCSTIVKYFENLQMVVSGHYHKPRRRTINKTEHISLSPPRVYNHLLLTKKNKKVQIEEYFNEDIPFL